ncbi:MAG TPA: hypothetical protein VEB22_04315, partial [Phycisphaerales bacterium]|nr:hypothetical protein [Phycisphaerales bacterium]
RSATTPPLPTNTSVFDFGLGVAIGMNNGWQATVPSGSNPLWVSAATAVGVGSTDNIAPSEWASPTVMAQDGAPGLNTATVFLYQRNDTGSAPSAPSSSLTYTFSTAALSGVLGAWTQTVPAASGGRYLFVTTATALATGATDTINPGEWAAVRLLAQDGGSGATGARGSLKGNGAQYGISTAVWSDALANRVINNMVSGEAFNSPLGSTSHLRIGDTVSLGNGSTFSEERFWSGGSWLLPGTVISGNLIVGGTISGQTNLNVTGYGKFEGSNSYTIIDVASGSSSSRSAALVANTSGGSQIAMYGRSTTANVPAVYGYNASTSGYGVAGVVAGGIAGYFRSLGSGTALYAEVMGSSYGEAVVGISPLNTGVGVRAVSTGSGLGLWVQGTSQFTGHASMATLTTSGLATVANLTISAASSTGSATATFPGNNKPGSTSTVRWVPMTVGGVLGDVPFWPRS